MRIGIDIDEVLAEYIPKFIAWFKKIYGISLNLNDFKGYQLRDIINCSEEEESAVLNTFSQEEVKYLEPIDGSKEIVSELARNHKLYVVTARKPCDADIAIDWVNRNYPGCFLGINLCRDGDGRRIPKSVVCNSLGLDILIEDSLSHMQDCCEHGINVLLFGNYPWNQYEGALPERVYRVNNWLEVLKRVDLKKTI